jgi:hypothetical protein
MRDRRLIPLTCLAVLLAAPSALSQWAQTYVEPSGATECGTSVLVAPAAFGPPGSPYAAGPPVTGGPDLDGDGVTGRAEDSDNDAVFATIGAALSNTSAGGIVNVMGPGIFQENLSVSSSVTIRAPAGGGAILEPPCSLPGNDGISVAGAVVVRVENLTVRGFAGSGITLDGTSGQILHLHACDLERNGTGLANSGGDDSAVVEVHDARIVWNTGDGITQWGADSALSVFDTLIAQNGAHGIDLGNEISWGTVAITRSRVVTNGSAGIRSFVNQTSTSGTLTVHDSDISKNTNEGVRLQALSGDGTAVVSLTNCAVEANGGDGIFMSNGGASRLELGDTRIVGNGGDGVEVSAGLTVDVNHTIVAQNAGYVSLSNRSTRVIPDTFVWAADSRHPGLSRVGLLG